MKTNYLENIPDNKISQIKEIKKTVFYLKKLCLVANVPFFFTSILGVDENDNIRRYSEGLSPSLLHMKDCNDTVIVDCTKLLLGYKAINNDADEWKDFDVPMDVKADNDVNDDNGSKVINSFTTDTEVKNDKKKAPKKAPQNFAQISLFDAPPIE